MVVPVPDGGTPAAIGYAQASGIPFELGIIRNHYVGRTFIEPTQSIRAFGVKLKHSANRAEIDGKRVVLIDDFDRARHHLDQDRPDDARCRRARGAYPRRAPDDLPLRLLRHRHARPARTCSPTSIGTLEDDVPASSARTRCSSCRSTGSTTLSAARSATTLAPQFTDHYFTGDYPTTLTDLMGRSKSEPKTLSLMREAS